MLLLESAAPPPPPLPAAAATATLQTETTALSGVLEPGCRLPSNPGVLAVESCLADEVASAVGTRARVGRGLCECVVVDGSSESGDDASRGRESATGVEKRIRRCGGHRVWFCLLWWCRAALQGYNGIAVCVRVDGRGGKESERAKAVALAKKKSQSERAATVGPQFCFLALLLSPLFFSTSTSTTTLLSFDCSPLSLLF